MFAHLHVMPMTLFHWKEARFSIRPSREALTPKLKSGLVVKPCGACHTEKHRCIILFVCVGVFIFRLFFFRLNFDNCSKLCMSRLHTWLLACSVSEVVYVVFALMVSVRVVCVTCCVFLWCLFVLFVLVWAHVHMFTYLYDQIDRTSHLSTLPTRNISHINVRTTTSRTNRITKTR